MSNGRRLRKVQGGEIFRDEEGGVWIVEFLIDEPSVSMRKIADQNAPFRAADIGQTMRGGVSAGMWDGFGEMKARTRKKRLSNV